MYSIVADVTELARNCLDGTEDVSKKRGKIFALDKWRCRKGLGSSIHRSHESSELIQQTPELLINILPGAHTKYFDDMFLFIHSVKNSMSF